MNYSRVFTERLVLRKPIHDDLQALFAVHSNPETNKFSPSGAQTSVEESKDMLERWLELWDEFGFGYWTIVRNDAPKTVLGFGGLSPKEVGSVVRPNLYFRFSPDAWGKGYATEMAQAALRQGCERLEYEKIVASVRPDNLPSIKVLERLGLQRDGETHDQHGLSYLYSWQC